MSRKQATNDPNLIFHWRHPSTEVWFSLIPVAEHQMDYDTNQAVFVAAYAAFTVRADEGNSRNIPMTSSDCRALAKRLIALADAADQAEAAS